jgi:hypothetical protein
MPFKNEKNISDEKNLLILKVRAKVTSPNPLLMISM